MILALSGLTAVQLEDTATELQVDYEVFLGDYKGRYLADAYLGFTEMLRSWSTPLEKLDFSTLNDLTIAQVYFAWVWQQNNAANYCCSGQAVDEGWTRRMQSAAVVAAVGGEVLCHAKALMASGDRRLVAGLK